MIYLDTHVVVWLYAGNVEMLSEHAKTLINEHEVSISQIVRLELQYLFDIQRVTERANEIVFDLSDRIGLRVCDKNLSTIVNAALDLSWTRDPFDRIIVANASVDNDILLTKDQNILKNYEKAIW